MAHISLGGNPTLSQLRARRRTALRGLPAPVKPGVTSVTIARKPTVRRTLTGLGAGIASGAQATGGLTGLGATTIPYQSPTAMQLRGLNPDVPSRMGPTELQLFGISPDTPLSTLRTPLPPPGETFAADGGNGDGGGGNGGGGGGGGGPAAPAEPEIPAFEGLPLGLVPPAWYKLNPEWSKVPSEARQFVSTINRLLPLFGIEDVPFIAGLISSIGGTQFARYGESNKQANFLLPDDGGTPDLNMRLTAASGLLGPLAPAARNLGQGLLPAAIASLPTRAARIGGHKDIQDLLQAQKQNPFAAILQRLVEPSAFRPAPGSMQFTRFGPRVVKNPALFV